MAATNPFADPVRSSNGSAHVEELTLDVGLRASLTIASNSLIVVGELHSRKIEITC